MALRHGAALPTRTGSDRSSDMETAPDLKLSPSEKGTLQKIAEGEYHLREFDWIALYHPTTHLFSPSSGRHCRSRRSLSGRPPYWKEHWRSTPIQHSHGVAVAG